MIYLFTYQEIKRQTEERTARSLRRFEHRRRTPTDSFVLPPTQREADIVELVFGTECESEQIGA